jgi:hypothetical protein
MPAQNDRIKTEWMSRGLYRAAEQVGRTPVERLSWLLEVIQLAGDDLARRDPHELLDEIIFFALHGGHMTGTQPRADIATLEREFLVGVRNGLEQLRHHQYWIVRAPDLNFYTSIKHGRKIEGSGPALFRWQAWNLVDEHREVLHRCQREQCDRWFVAVRPFQKYCTSKCGQVIHNRTYQKTKPAEHRSKLRRRSYLKTKERTRVALAPAGKLTIASGD